MEKQTLIDELNKAFPVVMAAPAEEFYGRDSCGIWLRGSEQTIDGVPVFDTYNDAQPVHRELERMINKAGWYWEPYDSGTLMVYPA